MGQIIATEFFVSVSMSDFASLCDDDEDACEPAPSLLAALKEAGLSVDVRELYHRYFDSIHVGQGDVYCYRSSTAVESIFAIDFYRALTDQLDIVSFGIVCDPARAFLVTECLHTFFRHASVQIAFEHACSCVRLRKLVDPTNYPFVVQESGYVQKLITAHLAF